MARIERISPTTPVTVEQAQLVRPSEFPFSAAGAEELKIIGGVLSELSRRKIEMQDRIGISNINAAMENAEREYQAEIIDKPLEEHAAILQKHKNNAMAFVAKQRLSADVKRLAENKLGIWADWFADTGEIATIRAIERDAIIRVTADYENALTNKGPEDIAEAEAAYDAQAKTSYTPAEAKVEKAKVEQRAVKQMEENAKQAQMNLAAINPEQVKVAIDTELKARRKGKKPSQEFALLSNTDLEAIRDYADSVGEKGISDSKIAISAAIEDSYAKIIGGDTDVVSMITAIQTDPTILDEDSNAAVEKIKTFFSTWHSTISEKIVTSDSTRIKALKIISDVRTADITEDEGLARYEKLSKTEKINGTDGKGFISGIFAASKAAKSYPLTTNRAKIYFGLLETLYKDGDIEPVEFDRMHTALRNFFEKTPEPTAKEATEFYEELIKDKARTIVERILNPIGWKTGTVASRIYGWIRGGRKGELSEPATVEEFEETVGILDEAEARKYYDKWKYKW